MTETQLQTDWIEKYRVPIGFLFAIIFLVRARPFDIKFLWLGLLISFWGILLRQWSAGFIRKNDELATTGPYAVVRNPLYLGSLLAASGLLISVAPFTNSATLLNWLENAIFWALLGLIGFRVYLPKILKEEIILKEKFKDSYDNYSKTVPRIIPYKLGFNSLQDGSFSFSLWKKNREYASLLGYTAITAFLLLRYFVF